MEGTIRSKTVWLVSVAVLLGLLFGLRYVVLQATARSNGQAHFEPVANTTPTIAGKRWGVLVNGYVTNGLNEAFDPERVDASIAILKDLGVTSVTLPYEARTSTEPDDAVNDIMIKKLNQAGIEIVLLCCDNFSFGEQNRYQGAYDFAQKLGKCV